MSSETPNKRIVEPESHLGNPCPRAEQTVPTRSESTPSPAPENTLDLDALGRLRTLFELLDNWDQKEKADEN
jgi:hypothetical protein